MSATQRILAKVPPPSGVRVRHIRAYAFEAKAPPVELQLWNVGDNPTDYGVHKWTERSAQTIAAKYASRGNPLVIDVEHNGTNHEPDVGADEPPATGGYAKLDIRDGAPWLTFAWSAYAVEQITTGQRLFLSPEYDVDKAGEIVGLYRVSLVADAGTHHARMLARAASGGALKTAGARPMDLKFVLAALRAALAAEDPAVAKESIASLVAELAKGGDAPAEGDDPASAAAEDPAAPVAASGEDPSKKDPPVAAAAVEPTACAAPAPVQAAAATVVHVHAAAVAGPTVADAMTQIENVRRDALIEKHGERLQAPVRVWASSQPYAVVKELLDATPDQQTAAARITATRGATQGGSGAREPGSLLDPEQRAEFQRITGTKKRDKFGPHIEPDGSLRVYACTPAEYRASKSAQIGGAK